jgi:NADH:ubiquinone oxidoreductase subunit F (NADH-binding)
MTSATVDTAERLLTSTRGDGPAGLDRHHAVHGKLEVPTGNDPSWRARTAAMVEDSGLFGRGGGAFPAARKWSAAGRSRRPGALVVNAMEGEPASAKDHLLLSRAPHLVLDGADVVAAVLLTAQIVVCIPDGADGPARVIADALAERRRAGLVRRRVSIERPPGRYVAGEESALAAWLDRRVALPAFRPDKSGPLGSRRRPLLVHNVETLAHMALIARYGAGWFRRAGTPDASGTALVTVSGAVRSPGVVEVELGTPVGQIVAHAGIDQEVAAVLVGGYGGAWVPADALDVPYTPVALERFGVRAGVGVLVVLPTASCGIAETARLVGYLAGESAGQCGPCVFGLPALAEDMALLTQGRPDPRVGPRLERRVSEIAGRGGCRHPDGAVRLVRSALSTFAEDLRCHGQGRPCRGVDQPSVFTIPPAPLPRRGRR